MFGRPAREGAATTPRMAIMTRRWIGTAIVLTVTAVNQPVIADDVAVDHANTPVSLSQAASPNASTCSQLPPSLADRPLPPQENLRLGSPDDANIAAAANDSSGVGMNWPLQTAMALGVVIGLVYVVRLLLRRANGMSAAGGSGASVIEVLGRSPVGPRTHVLLLRVNQRIIVAGQTQAGLNTLATLDDPDEVAGVLASVQSSRPTSITAGFNKLLGQFDRNYHAPDVDAEGADDAEHMLDRTRSDVSSLIGRIRHLGTGSHKEDDRS